MKKSLAALGLSGLLTLAGSCLELPKWSPDLKADNPCDPAYEGPPAKCIGEISDAGRDRDIILYQDVPALGDVLSSLDTRIDTSQDARASDSGRILTPYQLDEHCLALFHLDEANPLENSCNQVYALTEDYNSETRPQGQFAQARHFDGNSYLLGTGNMTLDITDAFTVEAWVEPDLPENSFTDSFGNIFHTTAGNIDDPAGYYGFVLWIAANENLVLTMGINGRMSAIDTPVQLYTDRFTHVAGTYDGQTTRLYINGSLAKEVFIGGLLSRMNHPDTKFSIGADRNSGNAFVGAIDEVRISNVAREF